MRLPAKLQPNPLHPRGGCGLQSLPSSAGDVAGLGPGPLAWIPAPSLGLWPPQDKQAEHRNKALLQIPTTHLSQKRKDPTEGPPQVGGTPVGRCPVLGWGYLACATQTTEQPSPQSPAGKAGAHSCKAWELAGLAPFLGKYQAPRVPGRHFHSL